MTDADYEKRIKDAAENIPVPKSLEPQQVETRLKQTTVKPRRPRGRRAAWAAAACLFLILAAGTGTALHFSMRDSGTSIAVPEKNVQKQEETAMDRSAYTTTYKEVSRQINACNKTRLYEKDKENVYESYNSSSGTKKASGMQMGEATNAAESEQDIAASGGSATEDFSDTDTQVDGVMEGDIVKTDGQHIFALKNTLTGYAVAIYQVDGPEVTKLTNVKVKNGTCREMYIENSRLILISSDWETANSSKNSPRSKLDDEAIVDMSYAGTGSVSIYLYDISDPSSPKEQGHLTQDGLFATSRLTDGCLYTFTNYQTYETDCDPEKPKRFVPCLNGEVIAEDHIILMDKKRTNSYMVMTSLSLDKPEDFADHIAALGGSEVYYMSNENIYMVKENWDDTYDSCRSTISKYSYKDGLFDFTASAEIRGNIEDSYYMHEYEGNFIFVYTRYKKNGSTTNGLGIMNKKLELQGELSGLGNDEEIYSSYYIENMAYFVTYRETDPVFAVDISNPKKPKLMSELKLPGFSSYLHSFGEGLLLGVGEGEKRNVKLSLFSIEDTKDVTQIAKQELAQETYSIAGENHRAVFVDEERSLVGLSIASWHGKNRYFVYEYKDGKFHPVLSRTLESDRIEDIRGLRIGEYFYLVDVEQGVKVYDINTWKKAD